MATLQGRSEPNSPCANQLRDEILVMQGFARKDGNSHSKKSRGDAPHGGNLARTSLRSELTPAYDSRLVWLSAIRYALSCAGVNPRATWTAISVILSSRTLASCRIPS